MSGGWSVSAWAGFLVFVFGVLAIDLGLMRKHDREIGIRESLLWSALWITLAAVFGLLLYLQRGTGTALAFYTGYLIEKALSIDNLFVFLVVFQALRVPASLRHFVLRWGIVGALVLRAVLIALGVTLVHRFHWAFYPLGAFLLITGVRMALKDEERNDSPGIGVLNTCRRWLPVSMDYQGRRWTTREGGRRVATPLLLTLLAVEGTDALFALDSIPAVLAITSDPFIVFTSNVFAVLGLRSLYFALAGVMDLFHFLKYGLAAILAFTGLKILIADWHPIPLLVTLGFILVTLTLSVLASLRWPAPRAHRS